MDDIEDKPLDKSNRDQIGKSIMSKGQNECQSGVRDLFRKLSSWKEESHKKFFDIINSQRCKINKSIKDLVEVVTDLQDNTDNNCVSLKLFKRILQ